MADDVYPWRGTSGGDRGDAGLHVFQQAVVQAIKCIRIPTCKVSKSNLNIREMLARKLGWIIVPALKPDSSIITAVLQQLVACQAVCTACLADSVRCAPPASAVGCHLKSVTALHAYCHKHTQDGSQLSMAEGHCLPRIQAVEGMSGFQTQADLT